MIKHTHTEPMSYNFDMLEERIIGVNDPKLNHADAMAKMLHEIMRDGKPTAIMATGGSKVIAYYLKLILEQSSGIVCEVIEPRDYRYKGSINSFGNFVVISASGNSNGIQSALQSFQGNKYLICEKERVADYQVINWANEKYSHEKSFISLASSLAPMTLLLDATSSSEIQTVNSKIKDLLAMSSEKVAALDTSFQDTTLIQIMSGYDTLASSSVLESNLTETGMSAAVVHDKGSFCHGRSNLIFQYPNSHLIYLAHQFSSLDDTLLATLKSEYPHLSLFSTTDIDENIFWKEYYLILQMYFLSQKIAKDKLMDLTQPEYNPNVVQKLYRFKGDM